MNFPKSIKIGPIDYEIKFVKNLISSDDTVLYGSIDYTDNKLYLSEEEKDTEFQNVVLIHEALHQIFVQLDIKNDETTIHKLGYSLYGFIKDNPELMKSFIKDE